MIAHSANPEDAPGRPMSRSLNLDDPARPFQAAEHSNAGRAAFGGRERSINSSTLCPNNRGRYTRNAVRSNAGHGFYVQAAHTVVVGNQSDSCLGFGLYFATGANYSSFGRNAMRENQGTLAVCTGGLFPPDACDESSAISSFGDNLIPGIF